MKQKARKQLTVSQYAYKRGLCTKSQSYHKRADSYEKTLAMEYMEMLRLIDVNAMYLRSYELKDMESK